MRQISEAREESNLTMNPYTAVIIQTEHKPFSDDFFIRNGLILPNERVIYTPPPFIGVTYSPHFFAAFGREGSPKITRKERIPKVEIFRKYLVCDDYASDGETFEISMIRLIEHGVKIENIWCLTQTGNAETDFPVLDRGIDWHHYRIRRKGIMRAQLEDLGFKFPEWIG